jgi:hypothetical protein
MAKLHKILNMYMKKQYFRTTVVLHGDIDKLKVISDLHRLTQSAMLRKLIEQEYDFLTFTPPATEGKRSLRKLLVEYQRTPAHIVQEKKAVYLEGQMLSSRPNNNKRIYPQRVLDESVDAVRERIRTNSFYGGITHDAEGSVSLDRASHIVTSLTKRGDGYYGRARILTGTPAGNILESIAIHHKGKIGFSSRGYGQMKKVGDLMEVVSPFTLAAIDTVSHPSGKDCWARVIQEGIKSKTYNLCEQQIGLQILREMGSVGTSLAGIDRNQFDISPYGYKWTAQGDFSRDGETFPDRMVMDSNEILQKLAELQSKPDFQIQDWQDAQSMKGYIAQVQDPMLRQQLYKAWSDAIGFQEMKTRATDFLSRWEKYNK